MDIRDQMRKMAEDSQKFMNVPECKCIACGRNVTRAALNLIWYYETPDATPIDGTIAKSIGGGATLLVQFPVCETCAPPCKKCHLPRRTSAVRRASGIVSQELGREASGFPGCRHTHILAFVFKPDCKCCTEPYRIKADRKHVLRSARRTDDSAARRPGRMDKHVFIGPPDIEARQEALRLFMWDRPQSDIEWFEIATRSKKNYSFAELKFVVDEAARAALAERRPINLGDLLTNIENHPPHPKMSAEVFQ